MFLSVGESFTAELTNVGLISPILGSPPRLLHEASVATVTVPEDAASSEVHGGWVLFFLVCFFMTASNAVY